MGGRQFLPWFYTRLLWSVACSFAKDVVRYIRFVRLNRPTSLGPTVACYASHHPHPRETTSVEISKEQRRFLSCVTWPHIGRFIVSSAKWLSKFASSIFVPTTAEFSRAVYECVRYRFFGLKLFSNRISNQSRYLSVISYNEISNFARLK